MEGMEAQDLLNPSRKRGKGLGRNECKSTLSCRAGVAGGASASTTTGGSLRIDGY